MSHVDKAAPGEYSHEEVAHALSLLCGAVLLFFGLFRLGWIIEFIPYIPISAFVTAASVTIMSTQIPTALGLRDIDTRQAPYKVIINTLKALPETRLDAAIGLSSIVLLFAIRGFCGFMERRQPLRKRTWSFISSLRLTFVMLLFTLISYLVHRTLPIEESKFRIVGRIEPGFKHANLPSPKSDLVRLILPELPAVAIILIIEHIAIAKAMGRIYNYTVNPSQEIVALGAANMFSPFVGGYVCTGSFGASAVLSKAGVRTPLAGLFSALVLVLALYVLTAVFYYIPNAALAGLIIHAVCNLIAPPKNLYRYWQLSPLEMLIWVSGVIIAILDSLETSIYVGTALSIVLLLYRLARTRGTFLGRVTVHRVANEKESNHVDSDLDESSRDIFLPLDQKKSSTNPGIHIDSPYPGVFIYRFSEGYNYTNQAHHTDTLVSHLMRNTRRMSEEHYEKESDRLWNDPGPRSSKGDVNHHLPYLRALVLDFSAVNNMDITSVQGLVDLRNSLDRYSSPDAVEWHFANVHNRWTRRALAASGFGYPTSQNAEALGSWQPAYSIANILGDKEIPPGGCNTTASDVEATAGKSESKGASKRVSSEEDDTKFGDGDSAITAAHTPAAMIQPRRQMATVSGIDRPFFHADLLDAVDAAVRDARIKDQKLG